MGPLLVDLVTAALLLTALYARPTIVLGVLVGTVMLIPATLVAPHLHTPYATVDRLVIASAALRLAAMARNGALRRDHFRATPLHLALALLAATWALAGVVFAPQSEQPGIAGQRIVGLLVVVIFFVVSLALLRLIDQPWLVLRMLTVTLVVAAGIAVFERFTGHSYGRWLFDLAGNPGPTVAAHVLETRAGHVRVRASAEFALAFAWMGLMLLPVVTVVALRMRRLVRIGIPVIVLVLLAIYWTYSRSAAAAVPVIFVLLAIGVRNRRTTLLAAAGVTASLVLFAVDPTIRHHLSLATDQGSVGIRFQRLPPILAAVAHHAYLGLGLGGLQTIGVTTTDNFYLAAYSETGVVGAAILIAFCVTALAQSARGLNLADSMRRSVVAASVIGFVAFLASGVFDDALLLGQPAQLALLLLAIATATAEPELGFAPMPKWSPLRAISLTSAGALIGLAAFLIAPVVVSQERTFSTVGPVGDEFGGAETGPALIGTICDLAHAVAPSLPDTHISCRDDFTAAGVGTLRVEAPTAKQTLAAYATLGRTAHQALYLTAYQTQPTGSPIAARATLWGTAPASGAALGFAIAWIAPLPLRRRRAPAEQVPDGEV
jgi:O-Antigen ligase